MPDTSSRRTQAERRATTEARLLDAATRLFAARGSRSVSIADVGEAAGYSRGIVTQHFGGKPQLLAAVVLHAQQFEAPAPEDGTGLDLLAALIRAYLGNYDAGRPKGQAFLMLWAEAIGQDPVLAPLFAERDAWFRSLIADRVREGQADGSVRADVDPQAAAYAVLATLRGIGLQLMAPGRHLGLDRLAGGAVDLVTRGLGAAQPGS
jgi:AcrR family transcriptional regulator